MPLLYSSLHRIGRDVTQPEAFTAHITEPGAIEYINELVALVISNPNRRSYTFQSSTVEVSNAISKYQVGDEYDEVAATIAKRLQDTEQVARVQGANLKNEIPHGLVVQAFIEDAVSRRLLIVKSDYDDFLDNRFVTRTGLPKKKKVFKAFLAELTLTGEIVDLYVCDSTGGHSKYWWHGFLELQEKRGDAHNTKTLWEALEKDILTPIRRKHRADYEIIRNAMILYVKSNERFELNDFIQNTIAGYTPQDQELSVTTMVTALRVLPTKRAANQFDTSFNIIKSEINARSKTTYHVTENIDLVVKTGIENFKNDIQSFEQDGIKYLKIRTTDEGFKTFARTSSTETS